MRLTDKQAMMIDYYFYEMEGYDHIRVNGDNTFRPEIVRAVNNIKYQIESMKKNKSETKNILDTAIDKERRRESDRRNNNR